MSTYKDFPTPWVRFYGRVPAHLDYPDKNLYELISDAAQKYPANTAWDFLGTKCTYKDFIIEIDKCASALKGIGLSKGDTVTICLPNIPQAVIMLYALNKIGAIASMIHPLSAPKEIEFYLNESSSDCAITLNAFYENFAGILSNTKCKKVILAKITDYLGLVKKIGFQLTKGRKIKAIPSKQPVIYWNEFMDMAERNEEKYERAADPEDTSIILYSGGTSGSPKGIKLSGNNFNALALQTAVQGNVEPGDIMMGILPVFHGFGLGVCIHVSFISGMQCILLPQFSADIFADSLKRNKPNFIAGVPTLYEALLKSRKLDNIDLKCLKGVFSGGDKLPYDTKVRVDELIKSHGGNVKVREGYGLTEAVTACCLTPENEYKEGSVGIPYSDTLIKIVEPGTENDVPAGTEGEICVFGPTVMEGYLNNKLETDRTLRIHADGRTWLHTGDAGYIDADGFVYYRQRIKRIIKCSGVAVYPSQIEDVLNKHPKVSSSCVIGVPDDYQIQRVKAFIVIKDGFEGSEELVQEIKEFCKEYLIKWGIPKEIEFRSVLPQTRVGKIAFSQLEEEERNKHNKNI
jgi:long-chain acyl-CoA synthetase